MKPLQKGRQTLPLFPRFLTSNPGGLDALTSLRGISRINHTVRELSYLGAAISKSSSCGSNMARKIVGIDLRVGSFYHRELWGAALCVAVSILAFAFVAVWVVFGASILLGLGNARRDTVVFLEGVFALILAPILGALLWRWGYYGLVRRPRELRIFDDGLVLVDVSGRELIVPYSDPSMDTLPWYVPPLSGPKAWMSVPGSGSMIWIPPEAMARINERRRPAGPGS